MAVLVVRPGTGDEQQEQPARHPVASTTMQPRISAVVFDLGGVLIDWDPRYLYRTLFDDEVAMEEFLATVTTPGVEPRPGRGSAVGRCRRGAGHPSP